MHPKLSIRESSRSSLHMGSAPQTTAFGSFSSGGAGSAGLFLIEVKRVFREEDWVLEMGGRVISGSLWEKREDEYDHL
ncbi:hypothetical protein AMTR_s00010p00262330 [Amborella trichopoda]|uniref:Uncharacterized protein n=1 Tax=Amborella trichopoda TaxID=13333 RepID=W1NG70_AMBTC|nr:hypothetical protein AMTR_s00010p00262330 [Amborella trichopoda]